MAWMPFEKTGLHLNRLFQPARLAQGIALIQGGILMIGLKLKCRCVMVHRRIGFSQLLRHQPKVVMRQSQGRPQPNGRQPSRLGLGALPQCVLGITQIVVDLRLIRRMTKAGLISLHSSG